ncbi:unnamed protein product, partial [Choristocarpus tenellus]
VRKSKVQIEVCATVAFSACAEPFCLMFGIVVGGISLALLVPCEGIYSDVGTTVAPVQEGVVDACSIVQPCRPAAFCSNTRLGEFHRTKKKKYKYRSRPLPNQWRRGGLTCSLEYLPRRTLQRLVPQTPTREQWASFWGRTGEERQGTILEAIGAGFLWMWAGFFASRTILGPTAWSFCFIALLLQVAMGPTMAAYDKISDLWGGYAGKQRTKGALFSGRVVKTGDSLVAEAPEHHMHFKMLVEDEDGRELLFDVPKIPEYVGVRRGMRCEVVVFSMSRGFERLTGVTEAYIPDLDVFVGQFPYLKKR